MSIITRVDFGVIWERGARGSMTQAKVPGLRPGLLPVLLMGLRGELELGA